MYRIQDLTEIKFPVQTGPDAERDRAEVVHRFGASTNSEDITYSRELTIALAPLDDASPDKETKRREAHVNLNAAKIRFYDLLIREVEGYELVKDGKAIEKPALKDIIAFIPPLHKVHAVDQLSQKPNAVIVPRKRDEYIQVLKQLDKFAGCPGQAQCDIYKSQKTPSCAACPSRPPEDKFLASWIRHVGRLQDLINTGICFHPDELTPAECDGLKLLELAQRDLAEEKREK